MKEELSLREVINGVIVFFIKFRILIVSMTILGTISVIAFQKLRPAYYNTTAIATSGISAFERIEDPEEVLNQRTAINLINNLQIDVRRQDFIVVADKLNISVENATSIRNINAEQIFRTDQDNKEFNTPKFEIFLSVKDNTFIKFIEEGLLYYFSSNQYVSDCYDLFLSTNNKEKVAAEQEIEDLRNIRISKDSEIDMSSFNVYSKNDITKVQNQIIGLIQLKSINTTNQELLKPLVFVQGFTISQVPERGILILGSFAFIISFLIAIVVALFVKVKQELIIK